MLRRTTTRNFPGEEGQDAGGLLREWYSVITREVFNPNYALFITAPGDRVTYMINKSSYINPEHLDYFKVRWRRYTYLPVSKLQ